MAVLAKNSENRLLANMPPGAFTAVAPFLQPLSLKPRQRLEFSNRPVETAIFLERGLASVVLTGMWPRRKAAEIAVIGREGMTGLALALGFDRSSYDVIIQVEGRGLGIAADELRRAMAQSPALSAWLKRYAYTFTLQVGCTALANAHGTIEERLARSLLMAQDRTDGPDLPLTHELLALMLGVRRSGVTIALHQLVTYGLIAIARGTITILDRNGLELSAHGLYGTPESLFTCTVPGIRHEPESGH